MLTPMSEPPETYDPALVARSFDDYGECEWNRHEEAPHARTSFHLHRQMLHRFIRPGDRVLEVGAGAGRFTLELAELGALVTVTDISEGQLDLNRNHVGDAGMEPAVERRERVDVVDLGRFVDGGFDAVVCFGGPLSYVLERCDDALAELLRVTKRGGLALASVMSLIGSTRLYLPMLLDELDTIGPGATDVLRTGFLPAEQSSLGVPVHMFTWHETAALIARHGCELVAATAANFLTNGHEEVLERLIAGDPDRWAQVLGWEERFAGAEGAVDGGTHIIFVVRRT
jgi:ubiquinone/menaquinone biosynthesis C-methylase UbiE